MYKNILYKIKSFFGCVKHLSVQFKNQYAYELIKVSTCPETMRHLVEIKINGKGQCVFYLAEEIVADNDLIEGFSPTDIRTITYLATSDKYETILRDEKIKKAYEIIRSNSVDNQKMILIRNKNTGESFMRAIQNFIDQELIDNLHPKDAHYIGYLAGQEQTTRDLIRLRTKNINNKNNKE